jgi:UDP-N-acetylglucosamine--N-acetylmuramyl-(pentapeptide) pyrophosphoryl-undecaprenol N-acetylglucosamine transferase
MKRLLIIAGGTGGHIFPALAVARKLRDQGVTVYWLGAKGGLETKLVAQEFPLHYISIQGLRGKGLLRKLLAPWQLCRATWQAYRYLRKIKADVVLGMGGYVTGPGGVAAWLARVPLVIHEQNAVAGYTNRLLSTIAKSVLQAFPNTFPAKRKVAATGNPVRAELVGAPLPQTRFFNRQGPLRILILGGSQGAQPINLAVLAALADYPDKAQLTIWHQTGTNHYETVKAAYANMAIAAKVNDFIDDMLSAYCWADLVICRAGALTVSEVATVGVASVFIPYPHAVDDHQLHNSLYLEQAGAAIIIIQQALTKERLVELFRQFANDRERLQVMAECARGFAQPKAVEQVIAQCEKLSVLKTNGVTT